METFNNLEEKKPKLNIGFFFLCLGLLITLITSVVSFLNLVFSALDKKFPDALNSIYQYGYSAYDYESIRIALATLIIFFPIFLIISYFWRKHIKSGLGQIDEIIKKWAVYIILFLSAIVVAVDLVILVKYFVSGEITIRFIYKVIITLITASIIGKYFYISEFWRKEGMIKKLNKIINPIAGVLLVVFAVVCSFSIMGSPAKQRLLRLDDKRVGDLQSIQNQVINYWQQKEKLPEDLKSLANPLSGYVLPADPEFEKGNIYEYIVKDKNKLKFELCATFSLPTPKGWQEYKQGGILPMTRDGVVSDVVSPEIYPYPYPYSTGTNDSWDHQIGRTCFQRIIDKDIYPSYPKVLKN